MRATEFYFHDTLMKHNLKSTKNLSSESSKLSKDDCIIVYSIYLFFFLEYLSKKGFIFTEIYTHR